MKAPMFFLYALSTGFLFSACEKQPVTSEPPTSVSNPTTSIPSTPVKLDADQLLQSFDSAGPEEKSRVGKAAQAIRAENHEAALKTLEQLLAEGHLTPEQKELVTGYVAQLQTWKQANP